MKKTIFLLLFTLFAGITITNAQDLTEKDVPSPVMTAFKQKYPSATDTKWKKTKNGKLEADFKVSDKKAEAKFSPEGVWLESKQRIGKAQVPAKIIDYVKKNYAGYEIDKTEFQEESKDNKKEYEVVIKKDQIKEELKFDAQGNFVKKKDKKDKKEQKEG
ncbi:PepSY-like domain-containing protein [Cytophagaceae bacterium YF14B1]|uniref:PepSY-like domain-containing protein n=1 Tax=Xanthocytophaga flava TaxID=3048013 RepID=A0AAE3QRH8_9BACT|nr:PepSY-like domain-containing protein [Xanthocytophaga flavus]MDJ1481841.1 PepSY-like domain-containing protein [Xanthocytophaga flavus]